MTSPDKERSEYLGPNTMDINYVSLYAESWIDGGS